MCGRLNIIADPLAQLVSETLGLDFWTTTNQDLRPSESISVIHANAKHQLARGEFAWGTQPNWSPRLLINAKSETVASKLTFRSGFEHSPAVVPCSGWYEWSSANGSKQKFLFESPSPVTYMAGIIVDGSLVTLTRAPTEQCAQYHHRMPLVLHADQVTPWLSTDLDVRRSLLDTLPNEPFTITLQQANDNTQPQMSLF